MNQEEFTHRYKHGLWGLMLDVSRCKLDGSARSLAESAAMEKIERTLGAIYRELTKAPEPAKPAVNGPMKQGVKAP